MTLSKRHLAILALIGAHVIWGAASPIFKWSLQDIPPMTLAFSRFVLASLLMLSFGYKQLAIKKQDFPALFFLGFIGITANIAFFFFGLEFTSSINVPVIYAGIPIILIIGSLTYLKEKTQEKVVIGTSIGLFGVLFLILRPLFESGHDGNILGNIFILLSALCVVWYTLLLKRFHLPYSAWTITFWTFAIGGLLFLPGTITEIMFAKERHLLTGQALFGIGYGAFFSSALAYLFYNFGVEYLKANEVGIFSYLEPITTIIVAVPLLQEEITPFYIVGSLFVFLGIFIAEGKFFTHPFHRAEIKKRDVDLSSEAT